MSSHYFLAYFPELFLSLESEVSCRHATTSLTTRRLGLLTPDNHLGKVAMMLSSSNFPSELCNISENFFSAPAKSMRHEKNKALAISFKTMFRVYTHLPLNGIVRPVANRVLFNS